MAGVDRSTSQYDCLLDSTIQPPWHIGATKSEALVASGDYDEVVRFFPVHSEQSSQKLLRKPFPPISGVRKFIPPSKKKKILLTPWRTFSSWWFQPLWKILVKMGFFPKWRVKITNIWSHHPLVDQQQSLSETNCWKSAPTVDSSARSAMHR